MTDDDTTPIKPDLEDILRVEREEGRLPPNATDIERAERYRLYQTAKLIRLYGPKGSQVGEA